MELHEQSIAQLSARLGAGEVSSTELTTHMLERIRAHDAALNGFVTVTEETALAQAKAKRDENAQRTAGIFCHVRYQIIGGQMMDTHTPQRTSIASPSLLWLVEYVELPQDRPIFRRKALSSMTESPGDLQ